MSERVKDDAGHDFLQLSRVWQHVLFGVVMTQIRMCMSSIIHVAACLTVGTDVSETSDSRSCWSHSDTEPWVCAQWVWLEWRIHRPASLGVAIHFIPHEMYIFICIYVWNALLPYNFLRLWKALWFVLVNLWERSLHWNVIFIRPLKIDIEYVNDKINYLLLGIEMYMSPTGDL